MTGLHRGCDEAIREGHEVCRAMALISRARNESEGHFMMTLRADLLSQSSCSLGFTSASSSTSAVVSTSSISTRPGTLMLANAQSLSTEKGGKMM
jgi:hypothetical protein